MLGGDRMADVSWLNNWGNFKAQLNNKFKQQDEAIATTEHNISNSVNAVNDIASHGGFIKLCSLNGKGTGAFVDISSLMSDTSVHFNDYDMLLLKNNSDYVVYFKGSGDTFIEYQDAYALSSKDRKVLGRNKDNWFCSFGESNTSNVGHAGTTLTLAGSGTGAIINVDVYGVKFADV